MRTRLMPCLIGLVVVTAFNSVARAEDHPSTTMTAEHERKHAKRLEHVGEWLTGFGAAHVIAGAPVLGVGLYNAGLAHSDNAGPAFWAGVWEFSGAMCVGIGAGLLAVGVPLWIIGHARDRRLERSSTVAVAPNRLALSF